MRKHFHAQLAFSTPGDIHERIQRTLVFCTDRIREADNYNGRQTQEFKYRREADYFSLFEKADQEKYRGESSTRYLSSEDAPKRISELQPDAGIIIMLRDPVDFIHSLHSEEVKNGEEDIENFEEALEAEKDRKEFKNMPRKVVCPSDLIYTERSRFSGHIKNWQRYFRDEHIKIVLLEEIKKDPAKIYKEILEFLQVENTEFTPEFKVYNANAKVRSKLLNDFIKNSVRTKRLYRLLTLNKLRQKTTSAIEKLNKRKVQRPALPEEIKKELKERFRPEVQRLAEITGKDLEALWEYK